MSIYTQVSIHLLDIIFFIAVLWHALFNTTYGLMNPSMYLLLVMIWLYITWLKYAAKMLMISKED
jgi:hypothetical protein